MSPAARIRSRSRSRLLRLAASMVLLVLAGLLARRADAMPVYSDTGEVAIHESRGIVGFLQNSLLRVVGDDGPDPTTPNILCPCRAA